MWLQISNRNADPVPTWRLESKRNIVGISIDKKLENNSKKLMVFYQQVKKLPYGTVRYGYVVKKAKSTFCLYKKK